MNIITKYNIGQEVWFEIDNKVDSGTITAIATETALGITVITYITYHNDNYYHFNESNLYPNMQELINDL